MNSTFCHRIQFCDTVKKREDNMSKINVSLMLKQFKKQSQLLTESITSRLKKLLRRDVLLKIKKIMFSSKIFFD